jgi:hypothetical protein
MRSTLILAVLAGVCVAVQTSLTGAAQRTLGPAVLVAISGLTTGFCALLVSFVTKPEFTGRAVSYALASGVLGAVIVGSIAVAAGQAGVARPLARDCGPADNGPRTERFGDLRRRRGLQHPESARGRPDRGRRRAGRKLLEHFSISALQLFGLVRVRESRTSSALGP